MGFTKLSFNLLVLTATTIWEVINEYCWSDFDKALCFALNVLENDVFVVP